MIPNLIPGIPYGPAPRTASVAGLLALPPRLIVIHDTSDSASAAAEAHYAATRTDPQANWTSCHAYIDTSGPLGSTPLTQPAWAAFSYANHNGWHLEMCGMNAGAVDAVPQATVAHTARLAAQLCDLAGIPKVHLSPADVAAGARGICGHYDITIGLGVGDHDDPGPRFDWAAFIGLVQGGTDMALKDEPLITPGTPNAAQALDDLWNDIVKGRSGFPNKDGAHDIHFVNRQLNDILAALKSPAPLAVDASAVAAALAADATFLAALAKAVNDDAAARLAS